VSGLPLHYLLFGKLRLSDFPPHASLIGTAAALLVIGGAVAVVVLITWAGKWKYLWSEWLTSLDHKKIGVMYIVVAVVMFLRAVIEAALMRTQQAMATGGPGLISAGHFAQLFSTHGTIMVFFMAMPFLFGVINFVMPLQIGARDMTFPFMNAISLWFTVAGAMLVMVSLVVGQFSTGGWSGYPPYTELQFSPGEGVDYWIWALTLSSIGSVLTAINFTVTIYKERAPGMNLFRMPMFSWTVLCMAILMIFAMPPLTVATAMLALDRYAGFHFFTNGMGGDMMNYANLFWLFGHPEVYILILPAFGVWSEVISTHSGKRLYGYISLVAATMCIAVLSFTVWLHHFFTMGQSANVNAVFGIATMAIGIPTGVKIYDWLLTMYRGRILFTTAMLFAVTFIFSFVIGGLSGIILANPTVDFAVHNSLFLVAHFHNMLIPGTLFALLAAVQFWFPKVFGYRLDEFWGRVSWACWTAGFYLAFMPLYGLGLMGIMRRTAQIDDAALRPWTDTAWAGAGVVLVAVAAMIVQMVVSYRRRDELAAPVGDPWDGHSLEWWSPSPPPEYDFAQIPRVSDTEAFTVAKRAGYAYASPTEYTDVTLPRNTGLPIAIGIAAGICGFALTWHIWWAVLASVPAMWGLLIWRTYQTDTFKLIPAATIQRETEAWLRQARAERPVERAMQLSRQNRGLARHGA
jgi:cytochrome o ubiquinol oxidase subunit 1